MIKKRLWAVCIAIFLAVQTAVSVSAYSDTLPQLEAIFGYITEKRGADRFYDALEAGEADWYAFCRARLYGAESGCEEFLASVEQKAQSMLESTGFIPPTDFQRTSLLLSAYGRENSELINSAVYFNENLDRQGLNAYIWALIAAAGAKVPENALITPDFLIEKLLSVQLADGGFNLFGDGADTDITAAAIYALAPFAENERVKSALDKAEAALTALQCESGGFMSVGVENCESASQAVIAFCALGYGADDERVSRALSAIMEYRQADGGFSHMPDGKTNAIATWQALEAFTAVELSKRGIRLFEVSAEQSVTAESAEAVLPEQSENTESELSEEVEQTASPLTGEQIKLIICGSLAAAAAAVFVIFFVRGKRNKVLIAAGAALCAAALVMSFLEIKTPEEYYSEQYSGADITVEISVECGNALTRMDDIRQEINPREVIPQDGIVISKREISLPETATAFDALIAAAKQERVRVDYTGSAYGVYISGIGYIYEFGFGAQSGWMYRVNGEIPQVSAGEYSLSQGDFVEFIYTCDIGGDIR